MLLLDEQRAEELRGQTADFQPFARLDLNFSFLPERFPSLPTLFGPFTENIDCIETLINLPQEFDVGWLSNGEPYLRWLPSCSPNLFVTDCIVIFPQYSIDHAIAVKHIIPSHALPDRQLVRMPLYERYFLESGEILRWESQHSTDKVGVFYDDGQSEVPILEPQLITSNLARAVGIDRYVKTFRCGFLDGMRAVFALDFRVRRNGDAGALLELTPSGVQIIGQYSQSSASGCVNSAEFSPDHSRIAIVGTELESGRHQPIEILQYDGRSYIPLFHIELDRNHRARGLKWSPDGKLLALSSSGVGSADHALRIWEVSDTASKLILDMQMLEGSSIKFSGPRTFYNCSWASPGYSITKVTLKNTCVDAPKLTSTFNGHPFREDFLWEMEFKQQAISEARQELISAFKGLTTIREFSFTDLPNKEDIDQLSFVEIARFRPDVDIINDDPIMQNYATSIQFDDIKDKLLMISPNSWSKRVESRKVFSQIIPNYGVRGPHELFFQFKPGTGIYTELDITDLSTIVDGRMVTLRHEYYQRDPSRSTYFVLIENEKGINEIVVGNISEMATAFEAINAHLIRRR